MGNGPSTPGQGDFSVTNPNFVSLRDRRFLPVMAISFPPKRLPICNWMQLQVSLPMAVRASSLPGNKTFLLLNAMYNYLMQIRRILLVLAMAVMLSACRLIPWQNVTPTLTPTSTSTATRMLQPTLTETPTLAFLPMCTPPLCAIGTSEVYYCSETCPNGCGTTCATYTPTPKPK
jgi:hypothetical protein